MLIESRRYSAADAARWAALEVQAVVDVYGEDTVSIPAPGSVQPMGDPSEVKVMVPVGAPIEFVGSLMRAVRVTDPPLGTGLAEKLSTFKVNCRPVTTWVTPGDVEVA